MSKIANGIKLALGLGVNVAIDVGSGYSKFTNGKITDAIPSVVCPYESTGEFGVTEDEVIEFNGNKYLTGESAVYYGDTPEKRFSTLTDEWAGSDGWLALIYRVIGDLGITTGHINLCTGLPQSYYGRDKEKILDVLNGKHNFMFTGIEHEVEITAMLIPQAAATLFYQADYDESILDDYVGCIDIGTYTTGFSVIDGMKFVKRLNGGVPVGMSMVYKKLEDRLKRMGFETDPAKFDSIVNKKKIRHEGESIDVTDEVNLAIKDVVAVIKDGIQKQWGNISDMRIYVTGGGARHCFEPLRESIKYIGIMNDPFFAVAKGMLIYLEESLKEAETESADG